MLTIRQLIDRLITDLIEITEDLIKRDSPVHALDALGLHQKQSGNSFEAAEADWIV